MDDVILQLEQIEKHFGEVDVLNGISISIKKGEFITLLGSSGCGKTTTLRLIAGLELPDKGRVLLEGKDVTDLAPNLRDVNTVFQNYALFPHMSVEANVGYSLKIKRVPKAEIKTRVKEALEVVQLSGYEKRMPNELSGGQRQRVAIARSIINNPKVLLLDEPLGALDLQLRRQMQTELKRIQKRLGITFIYITHDQEEALNMSDRIAVMRNGVFEQTGTPSEIYDFPKTAYVARFVGSANVLSGTVLKVEGDMAEVSFSGGEQSFLIKEKRVLEGEQVSLSIRTERLELSREKKEKGLAATVKEKSFSGGVLHILVELSDGTELISSRHGIDSDLYPGENVWVTWKDENAIQVEAEEEG